MEMRKDMPDEVKNQVIDGKKRVITEKIPDKYVKDIEDLKRKKGGLVQQFLQLSIQLVNAQTKQSELLGKIKDTDQKIGNIVDYAFKKLKLHKQRDRKWSLRGNDFVGVINPPKPKQKQEKK